MSKEREEFETIKALKKYRGIKYGMKAGTYLSCMTPSAIILGVNWDDWFGAASQAEGSAPSIGVGFGMLAVSTIATIVAVMKRDSDFMKKFSALFYVAILCALWAVSFMFLSSIMNEMGQMFLYIAYGVACGGIFDEGSEIAIKPRYEFLVDLADKNGLTRNGSFKEKQYKRLKEDLKRKEKMKSEAYE